MGTVSKKHTFTAGTTILSAQVNENFDDIYNEFNGNITNANINGSAAIVDTKLAQITTAGKVDATTALTGLIPSASQDTELLITFATPLPTDASAATIFYTTATSSFTLANPTNSVAGMKRIWRITQGGAGTNIITLDSDFRVSDDINGGTLVLSTGVGDIDYIGAMYNGVDSKWDIIAFTRKMT